MISPAGIQTLQTAFQLAADVPMSQYTRFKVGGPADLLALPRTRQELQSLLTAAREASVPVTVVGGGCNLLVSDRGIRGLVVVTTRLKSGIRSEPQADNRTHLHMAAGEGLSTVCQYALTHGLSGLEFCAGIPGTVGGAVMMNAGTASQGIGQAVHCLKALDLKTLAAASLKKQDLNFSYRRLDLSNHLILEITLELVPGDPDQIRQAYESNLRQKHKTQPMALPSAGCFFKNPRPDMPAGKLIQEAGLKGKTIRGARVSEIHANYIVNCGHATCRDILALKSHIQEQILDRYGIFLETEVQITGDGIKNE
jgi:UDP-N-acetylmuramate dehydrogenase